MKNMIKGNFVGFTNGDPTITNSKVTIKEMTNNKQQTTLQTLIDGLIVRKENIIKNADSMPNDMLEGGVMAFESAIDLAQSLLEMEKEQMAVEIQKFVYKVNEKIDRELGWCGGPRNKSFEMENWRKAYANVRKWMQNLNKEFQQTYGGGEQ
jgi:hypothetical protein